MKLSSAIAALAGTLAISNATPLGAREESLESWFTNSVYAFFPNHTGWEDSYKATMATSLNATFGRPVFNYTSLQTHFSQINAVVNANYDFLSMEFTSVTAVPDAQGLGGIVTATGHEQGKTKSASEADEGPNGVYAVIGEENGVRKVTEWRESSAFPFKAS